MYPRVNIYQYGSIRLVISGECRVSWWRWLLVVAAGYISIHRVICDMKLFEEMNRRKNSNNNNSPDESKPNESKKKWRGQKNAHIRVYTACIYYYCHDYWLYLIMCEYVFAIYSWLCWSHFDKHMLHMVIENAWKKSSMWPSSPESVAMIVPFNQQIPPPPSPIRSSSNSSSSSALGFDFHWD